MYEASVLQTWYSKGFENMGEKCSN